MIYYSHKSAGSSFDPADIFLLIRLLEISNLKELDKILQHVTIISEEKFSRMISTKAINFIFKDKAYIFEDKTIVVNSDLIAEGLAYIFLVKKFIENDTQILDIILNKFFIFLETRKEKLKELKLLREKFNEVSRQIKTVEASLFSFSVPQIPSELKIKENGDKIFISKEVEIEGVKIISEAVFTKELLLKEINLIYNGYQIPVKIKQQDKEKLLFSPSFYTEVSSFLDLKEYKPTELLEIIKTVISLQS